MLTVLSLLVYFVALTNGADKKKCADHLTANTGGLSPTHSSDHYLAEDTGKGYPPGASIHYSVTVSGSDCTGLTCVLACHYKRNSGGDDVEYNWSKIKCSTGGSGWKSAGSYFAEGSVPSSAKTKAKDLLKAKGDISAHFADYGELFEDDEYEDEYTLGQKNQQTAPYLSETVIMMEILVSILGCLLFGCICFIVGGGLMWIYKEYSNSQKN